MTTTAVPGGRDPIALTPEEFGRLHGISRAEVYTQLSEGKIIGRKNAKRTLIYLEDNEGYRESLPRYKGGAA
jgi:hypothetical protein